MRRLIFALALLAALPATAEMAPRDGWAVLPTTQSYEALIGAVKTAAKANKLGVVTEAGPTGAAANRGVTIPGNRVIGLFNNVYAVRILNLSTPAMIEAPIRMYVTENDDGTATLSYKLPSTAFAPYFADDIPDLQVAAEELDAIFAAVAAQAAGQ
ncbi:MAG: DUF302 domain-containing protein [Pseudomonadota bacterium]